MQRIRPRNLMRTLMPYRNKVELLRIYLLHILFLLSLSLSAQRWNITPEGAIAWRVMPGDTHQDHIELSGEEISAVLRYGVTSQGTFELSRSLVFPRLRTLPDDTRGSLNIRLAYSPLSEIIINDRPVVDEQVDALRIDGTLVVESRLWIEENERNTPTGGTGIVRLKRTLFPSRTHPAFCESYLLINNTQNTLSVQLPSGEHRYETDPEKGKTGSYTITSRLQGFSRTSIAPGDSAVFSLSITATAASDSPAKAKEIQVAKEYIARKALIEELWSKLRFESPDTLLNRTFAFAKIRAAESIYRTAGGLMHGPGGENYYAAIWANDQAEYINPFFPFLGYALGTESALNSFLHFARYMNSEYKPIPSSIIAEGRDFWNGAGDRGDAAMIAYGAARYALATGDSIQARTLWPLIEWCLEYCRRKLNAAGVVASDSDELEGRFPAGEANLCTSSLYYDALISAVYLGKELQIPQWQLKTYQEQSQRLCRAIEAYFGANVEGFETYRYYEGNDLLRSWICIPLTVGIFDRKEATVAALFSPELWTENGLLTQSGSTTFWDRSTLYALRGVFAAGAPDAALQYLTRYSQKRLLGDHVPYPIEAWPEGEQRHLSAESGLYCRIITEGIFGIRPVALNAFTLTPQLPQRWTHMALRSAEAFGREFDIEVERLSQNRIRVRVLHKGIQILSRKIVNGTSLRVEMKGQI